VAAARVLNASLARARCSASRSSRWGVVSGVFALPGRTVLRLERPEIGPQSAVLVGPQLQDVAKVLGAGLRVHMAAMHHRRAAGAARAVLTTIRHRWRTGRRRAVLGDGGGHGGKAEGGRGQDGEAARLEAHDLAPMECPGPEP
jgi:hypothetical protein